MPRQRFHHQMDVVRHDAPSDQFEPFAVKVLQRPGDDPRYPWLGRHPAPAMSIVERRLEHLPRQALGFLPQIGHRILVPGQVEDDASILKGAGQVCTNLALLQATRDAHPNAVIIYKPHPDVEAGLRTGKTDAEGLADVIATRADMAQLLGSVDKVWTMTSGTGFEALLRGIPVTTLGAPFYAGWGLTTDLGPIPDRRKARPDLAGLVHAVLIDYARYVDPVTGQPCPVEVAAQRLASGSVSHPGAANRVLSKLQGLLATYAHLWR